MVWLSICMWFANLKVVLNPFNHIPKKPKVYSAKAQFKKEQKALRKEEKYKYKFSLLPESGYMTLDEYLDKSKEIPNSDRTITEYEPPKDIKMEYVPQPKYKLVRYNSPPGSSELKMSTKLKFDRKFICPGIVSPQKDIIAYPVVFYYAENQCSAGEIFVIPLDKTLPPVKRVMMANMIKQYPDAILSTDKDISEKFIFKTMTPIDFSKDGTLLVAKEKIGSINDGVWQTNLWVYNFRTQNAIQLPEVREAIKYYWNENKQIMLDEKRWDIYPMGFSGETNEIVVTAYAYTGHTPKFLGTWSTDINGENVKLLSINSSEVNIQENGYKLVQDGYIDPAFVHNQSIVKRKQAKANRKKQKKAEKAVKKLKKDEYRKK